MPSPLKDITTKAADTWAEWMIPEECTIKAEDIKADVSEDGRFYDNSGRYQGRQSSDGRYYDNSCRYQGRIQNND